MVSCSMGLIGLFVKAPGMCLVRYLLGISQCFCQGWEVAPVSGNCGFMRSPPPPSPPPPATSSWSWSSRSLWRSRCSRSCQVISGSCGHLLLLLLPARLQLVSWSWASGSSRWLGCSRWSWSSRSRCSRCSRSPPWCVRQLRFMQSPARLAIHSTEICCTVQWFAG